MAAKTHKPIALTRHPAGPVWAYCGVCHEAVTYFLDSWWHIRREAPTPKKKPSGEKGVPK